MKHSVLTLAAAAFVVALTNPAGAANPKSAPDDSWISVTGTIVSTTPTSFRLDYGDGMITVEMDDFDTWGEGRALMENDKVVVYGAIDDDLYEKRTIEASSVYVENLNTHFYASAADEEDFSAWSVSLPIVVGQLELTGTVTSIVGREFTVDTGNSKVQIDTMGLAYNPMDDDGFLKVDLGDRVKVGGDIDVSYFDDTELSADWIIELED